MKYGIQKITSLLLTLLLVSFITFIAFQVIPGDSVISSLGTHATPEAIEALREELGLNENVLIRYGNWLKNTIQGDFGTSLSYNLPVVSLIKERIPVTLTLAGFSIVLILAISIPLGAFTGRRKGGVIDNVVTFLLHLTMAIPPFFLGIILTLVFGLILKWFIPGNYISYKENPGAFMSYMIFPAIAMALPKIAMVVKFLRSSIIRQLQMDYVRTAKSKGNTERDIMYRHVLKNAFLPVITFIGMVFADVLTGSIIIEQVFSLPGIGRLLIATISNRDYPVVQIIILYTAAVVILLNFIVDILYRLIDPRVRK
jgi:peptide/nickel transport system permease protein/oligopeptide transport system permease protein